MKTILLGVAIILFGISLILAVDIFAEFVFAGFIVALVGIVVSFAGYFKKDERSK